MATGKSFSSSSWSRSSNIGSKSSSSSSSSSKGKSVSSITSSSNAARSAATSSIWSKSSSSSGWTGKSLWSVVSHSNAVRSAWTASIWSKSGWGSSSSSSGWTGKSISSAVSSSNAARNNWTSSISRSSWGGGWGWSSSSSGGISSRSELTAALNRAVNNKNASISSSWWNTTIATKTDTNKLIPGTSIKTGWRTNYQTFDADGNLIEDLDTVWTWYWVDTPDIGELYVWESNDDEDTYGINPYEDVMNWAWDQEESNSVEEGIEPNDEYDEINEAYKYMDELRDKMNDKEEVVPEKSAEEKRLETPAFNQFSWNSFVENRPAELSPVNVPNPNDPLTDPTSYDAPITEALNKLGADINMETPQQVDNSANINAMNEATGMPQYNWDINATMQWYNNVFSNIENRWIDARNAREFAQAYNNAKADIERYVQEHWLSQEEYDRLLAQLRNHPLISQLSNNQWQWKK